MTMPTDPHIIIAIIITVVLTVAAIAIAALHNSERRHMVAENRRLFEAKERWK